MRDLTEEMKHYGSQKDDEIIEFVNGADQGSVPPKKVKNKYNSVTLAFNKKQREFFDDVKKTLIEKHGRLPVSKFLTFLWQYHLQNKCNFKNFLDYSFFLSEGSNRATGDIKTVTLNWNMSLVPLRQQEPIVEMTFGKIGLKGTCLIFALHYAKNELNLDLTPYMNKL